MEDAFVHKGTSDDRFRPAGGLGGVVMRLQETKLSLQEVQCTVVKPGLRRTQVLRSEVKHGINQVLHSLIHYTHTHTHTQLFTTSLHTHSRRRDILILQGMDTLLIYLCRCFIHSFIALL